MTTMTKAKKILIISFHFPPRNRIGSLRVGKFAKYLNRQGWDVWILTTSDDISPDELNDLQVEVPEGQIIRADLGFLITRLAQAGLLSVTKMNSKNIILTSLQRLLSSAQVNTKRIAWIFSAIKKIKSIIKEQDFDLILSSYGPAPSHLVASYIAKKYNIPWIADYRDLWTENHLTTTGKLSGTLTKAFEKFVMKPCAVMTTVSGPLCTQLKKLHKKPVHIVFNGFDTEDYHITSPENRNISQLKIAYTGTLYRGKRDPSLLFKAISELAKDGLISSKDIAVEFIGADPNTVKYLAESFQIDEYILIVNRIPYRQTIKKQIDATVLLLLEWNDPQAKGVYTGKVFEYLGAQRPILAIGPQGGVVEQLLQETNAGALYNNVSDLKKQLLDWVWELKSNKTVKYNGNINVINQYSRLAQSKIMNNIANTVINS